MAFQSEDHILALIDNYFPDKNPSLLLGRGDDCAVMRPSASLCVSSDLFLEDVHFRRAYFKPEEVGHKALAVNISDIAAMGVKPLGFTLALGLPEGIDLPWLDAFFQGMSKLAAHHRMVLAGGDLSRASGVHICITVWGEGTGALFNAGQGSFAGYLTRGGAMPGDSLFVVGALGLARVGLSVLEHSAHDAEGQEEARREWPAACAAHVKPLPQVDAGLIIARAGRDLRPPVLMDLSDGLARDLPRLLGRRGRGAKGGILDSQKNENGGEDSAQRERTGLGAQVLLPEALLHAEVVRFARQRGLSPFSEAWLGGEDYALLGACVPDLLPALHAALPSLQSIGVITDDGEIFCNGAPVPAGQGFDHFHS